MARGKKPPGRRSTETPTVNDRVPTPDPTLPASPAALREGAVEPTFEDGAILAARYRIVRFIGEGGMGEVYEAEDQELRARVALKTVRAEIADRPVVLERFRREIALARQVTHKNVCRTFDVGYHEKVPFLTMELLEGETLDVRLQRDKRLAPAAALPIVVQM